MKKKCLFCGTEFDPTNGTNIYCPDSDCYDLAKKQRQKILDDMIKAIRKGMRANLNLFTELLANKSDTLIDLNAALKKGFDQHAFYISAKEIGKDFNWYYCGSFMFSIQLINETLQLVIFKK